MSPLILKVCHGRNWKTLTTEEQHYDRISWTSAYVPDTEQRIMPSNVDGLLPTTMRVFYRQPTQAQQGENRFVQVMLFPANAFQEFGGLSITLPRDIDLSKVVLVQLVCEIMLDGSVHPHPFARLPDVGPFSGYRNLNCLGVRAVFQRGDKWVSCHVQQNQFFDSLDSTKSSNNNLPERDLLNKAYIKPYLLIDALMRAHYEKQLPAWKWNTRNLTIKNVHYDHMEQVLKAPMYLGGSWRYQRCRTCNRIGYDSNRTTLALQLVQNQRMSSQQSGSIPQLAVEVVS